MDRNDRFMRVVNAMSNILIHTGAFDSEPAYLDLKNTPARVARMYMDELLSSYKDGALDALRSTFTTFPCPPKQKEMVLEDGIPMTSLCAHHLLPFSGVAHVGYIPGKRVVGLSKIPRVVEFFSRKLQMQERLTGEIADFLMAELKPKAVIVLISAEHHCMSCRGVKVPGVRTKTSAVRALAMSDATVRAEFYKLKAV